MTSKRGQTRTVRISRVGDRVLFALCALAGVAVVATLVDVAYQLFTNARPSINRFGLGFLVHTHFAPNFGFDYAGSMVFGTLVTSLMALALAAPLGVAIGLYLSMMAPTRVRGVVGPLVEMLAAVPSIIYGFWGLVVLVPFIQKIEPGLHGALGFIPLFGAPQSVGLSIFAAGLVLTVMILPIISALSRDLFLTVPNELREGAEALGATKWEVIRGVVLPTTISGVTAAMVLALGRALGEAVAVSFVVGGTTSTSLNVFHTGNTLAQKIVDEFFGTDNALHLSSLWYAGLVLLVIGLTTSLAARLILGRFDVQRALAR